ncbi:MAG: archease [Candidatus Aenigmatarchaeota archaeon]
MRYEIVDDITSDVMFKAYGKSLEELIENSGEALFSIVCDIKKIKPKRKLVIKVEGEDERELIHNWLSKLLSLIDIENIFFSKFKVIELKKNGSYKLKVEGKGEDVKPELILTVAKAVTYYKYDVGKTKDGWFATVVLDV